MKNEKSKQGWFEIPVGPGSPVKHGYFVNGKLQALAYNDGSWCFYTSTAEKGNPIGEGRAGSLLEAKQVAEAAVWEK